LFQMCLKGTALFRQKKNESVRILWGVERMVDTDLPHPPSTPNFIFTLLLPLTKPIVSRQV
jgi:hypothetical protein